MCSAEASNQRSHESLQVWDGLSGGAAEQEELQPNHNRRQVVHRLQTDKTSDNRPDKSESQSPSNGTRIVLILKSHNQSIIKSKVTTSILYYTCYILY